MKRDLLDILACPGCRAALELSAASESDGEIESGTLRCTACATEYPIVRFVPRFVPRENYAGNFGLQWNRFRRTQLDSHSGVPISRDRFFVSTGWSEEAMRGRRVLDVGCGAGRFAEVALSTGARLVAVDFSEAVEACRDNLAPNANLDVVQADIYALPFKPGSFDFVYCLGVLQHTPDVKRSFLSLPVQLKAGGKLAVDVYADLWLNRLWPKYWLRPITKRMDRARLLALIERSAGVLLALSRALAAVPVVGRRLRYAVPVMNVAPDFPQLNRQQVREWAVLDTFDMLSPTYDQPQSIPVLDRWFREAGLRDIEVFRHGPVIGRGSK